MAFFLFVDESGQDHHQSPYEVLAGVAVDDRNLWSLIRAARDLELNCFGRKYSEIGSEIKARTFLKRKTFRLAAQLPEIPLPDRTTFAKRALDNGSSVRKIDLTALAQAKLDYVEKLFLLCHQYQCKVFASITSDENSIKERRREELDRYLELIKAMRYRIIRKVGANADYIIWSVVVV